MNNSINFLITFELKLHPFTISHFLERKANKKTQLEMANHCMRSQQKSKQHSNPIAQHFVIASILRFESRIMCWCEDEFRKKQIPS